MASYSLFSPAKLNLFLAVTGRRPDGFHHLLSVVAPLELGDTLTLELSGEPDAEARFTLTCSNPEVPRDDSNLVLRAANAFAASTGWHGTVAFHLEKVIPMGAGLGGGSSNAAATLRALNTLAGEPLDGAAMVALAATLGSDCPLFLYDQPVVMRGRGEQVDTLPEQAASRLRGRKVLVFKPPFGIPTEWAYRKLAEDAAAEAARGGPSVYLPPDAAEKRLQAWLDDPAASPEALLFNNLERPAFGKYIALPTLLVRLRTNFGLQPRMTGSGSACFAFLPEDARIDEITAAIQNAWGAAAFVATTRIA